jgi:hypothetical protein
MSIHTSERPPAATQEQSVSNDPHMIFARQVADMLGEDSFEAFCRIYTIVRVLGRERVMRLLKKTLAIENNGGLRTQDGTRRRTTGGVFFFLSKGRYKKAWARANGGKQPQPASSTEK